MHTEGLVAIYLGEPGGSRENVGYLLEGWCFVVLSDDCLILGLWGQGIFSSSIFLLWVHQAADPFCGLSLFGDDSLPDHLC